MADQTEHFAVRPNAGQNALVRRRAATDLTNSAITETMPNTRKEPIPSASIAKKWQSWASTPGRRRNMQAIRSRDTKPELDVRRRLHRSGLRYRVAIAPESGLRRRADIVFTAVRVAVFIDGCFWHGCPEHRRESFNHNVEYWPAKIAMNMVRDSDTNTRLREAGWTVLRFWEHEDADEVANEIARVVLERRR
ncbi:very short patch repair endonuclease [Nocardia gamkensis]|uniref:very short patch repair endonuclease n=1 Tax=Nocardia gamkensis TaxID=352869 RepID=UPI0033F07E4F